MTSKIIEKDLPLFARYFETADNCRPHIINQKPKDYTEYRYLHDDTELLQLLRRIGVYFCQKYDDDLELAITKFNQWLSIFNQFEKIKNQWLSLYQYLLITSNENLDKTTLPPVEIILTWSNQLLHVHNPDQNRHLSWVDDINGNYLQVDLKTPLKLNTTTSIHSYGIIQIRLLDDKGELYPARSIIATMFHEYQHYIYKNFLTNTSHELAHNITQNIILPQYKKFIHQHNWLTWSPHTKPEQTFGYRYTNPEETWVRLWDNWFQAYYYYGQDWSQLTLKQIIQLESKTSIDEMTSLAPYYMYSGNYQPLLKLIDSLQPELKYQEIDGPYKWYQPQYQKLANLLRARYQYPYLNFTHNLYLQQHFVLLTIVYFLLLILILLLN